MFTQPNRTMNRNILAIALLFLQLHAASQEVYHFTKGLAISTANRYGREAIYTDQLAYQLYTNTLKTPKAGDTMGVNDRGQAVTWQAVTADSINRFRMRGGFGGGSSSYLYLTYMADREKTALLNLKGNSALFFNGELHTGDAYAAGYLYIPVKLKKGLNELYVRGGQVTADLLFPAKPVLLNTDDPTLPHIVLNSGNHTYQGAVVVVNTTGKELKGLQLKAALAGTTVFTPLPAVPPMSTRKVPFRFDAANTTAAGQQACTIALVEKGKDIDEKKIVLEAVNPTDKHSNTFISEIDGSLQYFAVTPQTPRSNRGAALFLSVHGAGVEAIGQARAYQHKDWGTLVAATNRRPRGFNWEDWGRLDALEVLSIATQQFQPDPQHIYLTGHSMGGHGTWFLGATYPDKWAGIGPCSGYPTLKGYGSADGMIPDSSQSPMEQMLLRAGNQSDVLKLVNNYKPLGVYVLHGDADRVVSVRYARQMKKVLSDFHTDISYYEYPNGEHWFGDQSVDWKPLFDYFKWHSRLPDSAVNVIDFTTSSPGISDAYRWASVQQQEHPLQYSRLQLTRSKGTKMISGATENVRVLKLALNEFGNNAAVSIKLDSQQPVTYTTTGSSDSVYLLKQNNTWTITTKPALAQKGPHRYGTFKEAFKNRMVFVYGTTGTAAENTWSFNKARYDAETWYYRGNGAVDIIADKQYAPAAYAGRSVILYGNATTNAAWKILLNDCPVQVSRNKITAGNQSWEGDDLGAYFIWPMQQSPVTAVAVVAGSGIKGMHAASANQYFAGGSGFPDFMIFSLEMLQKGVQGIKMAGFFDNDWKLSETEMQAK
jgi:predicted esterase